MIGPTFFVIFGATGDLVDKKLIPALYTLYKEKKIDKNFKIIAFARRDFNNGKYNEIISHSLETYAKTDLSKEDIDEFYKMFTYHQGQFDDKEAFVKLAEKIENMQTEMNICAHKMFYLAVPSTFYEVVIKNIEATQLKGMCDKKDDIWARLLLEKPFGHDLESAEELNNLLSTIFKKEQLYLIDHYLGKALSRNILPFRKKYNSWNKDTIEKIEIATLENLGVETRGDFYDPLGALRDFGQNHLLELTALLTMKEPSDNNFIELRSDVIEHLKINDIKQNTFRAQYEGYRSIENVDPNSNTETYFKVRFFVDKPEWENVPIVIESGKKLGKVEKQIKIYMQNGEIIIMDFDKEDIVITKLDKPSETVKLKPIPDNMEGYAVMIYEAILGIKSYFIDTNEVFASWKFIDPIEEAWQDNIVPLEIYKQDSMPKASF